MRGPDEAAGRRRVWFGRWIQWRRRDVDSSFERGSGFVTGWAEPT